MRPDIRLHEGGHTSSTEAAFRAKFGIPQNFALPSDTVNVLRVLRTNDPTIRPLVREEPSGKARTLWREQFVNLFTDKERAARVADTMLTNLTRIPQDRFESALVDSFLDAQTALQQQRFDPEKTRFLYYSGYKGRSEEWVRDICSDYLPDSSLLSVPMINNFDKTVTGTFETGVVMDDASYTGTQVVSHIREGAKRFGIKKFAVIVPFITDEAVRVINGSVEKFGGEVQIYMKEQLPTLPEILGEEDYQWLKQSGWYSHAIEAGQTLTYFAHKVPDYRSLVSYIVHPRHAQVERLLDALVPQRHAPYKAGYMEDLRNRGLL